VRSIGNGLADVVLLSGGKFQGRQGISRWITILLPSRIRNIVLFANGISVAPGKAEDLICPGNAVRADS
jgi:hypothetical protein